MPVSTPSFPHQLLSDMSVRPTAAPRTDYGHRIDTHPSSKMGSINSLAEDLCDLSVPNKTTRSRRDAHKAIFPDANSALAADTIGDLRREFHETLIAHNAARDRKLHEMEAAHDAQTRALIEIIESTRAEVSQLRGLLDTQHAPSAENHLARPVAPPVWSYVRGSDHPPAPFVAPLPIMPVSSPPSYNQLSYAPEGVPGGPSGASEWRTLAPAHPAHMYSREPHEQRDAYYPPYEDSYQSSPRRRG